VTNTEKFFVECVKRGIKSESVERVPEGLDYKQLYNLCAMHSMSVIMYKALEAVKDQLPPRFFGVLQNSAHRHVVWDVQSEYDINTVLTAFEENGIKHMPLKGYHLKQFYPSTDMRYASDCDILIDVKQLKKIRALIKELGLVTKRYDEHHDIVYYPDTKTVFELHKTVFVGNLEQYFGGGFERAHVREGRQYFYEMTPEVFYVSILGHSAYHFAEAAGVGIRHLTDIYLYRKSVELDESIVQAEVERCGLTKFKEEFEKLTAFFFDDAEADELTLKLAAHVLESSLLSNTSKQSASEIAAHSKYVENDERAKTLTLWRMIFPPVSNMKFSYPILKKAIWLLPLFYVIRWFHVLFARPERIKRLKSVSNVEECDLKHMKEMRSGLGINHL